MSDKPEGKEDNPAKDIAGPLDEATEPSPSDESAQSEPSKSEAPRSEDTDEKPESWNPAAEPPPRPEPESTGNATKGRGSSPIAWFALLLVLALCVAAGWSVLEAQRREAALTGRLVKLESVKSTQRQELEEMDKRLQGTLESSLAGKLAGIESASAAQEARLSQLQASLTDIESSVQVQGDEIARFGATDQKDWLMAEAEYLLRLANQRLIMAGDTEAAIALLKSADGILLELDEVSLHDARAAVASDIAALRAAPKVDVEGLYLRLAALIGQVERLAIFTLPDNEAAPEEVQAEDWQARLQQGYAEALHKLSDYVVIRRRDVPYEVLMDPQWEGIVRQNMRMLLEQAQVALLSGNQILFRESLQRANHWVEQFFEVDESGAKALARDITALTDEVIAADIPDLSASLRALDDAVMRRLQLKDGQ